MAYECSKCHRMQYTNICIQVGRDKLCRQCSEEMMAKRVREGAKGYDKML